MDTLFEKNILKEKESQKKIIQEVAPGNDCSTQSLRFIRVY